jgi:hypothetical protein
MAISDQQTQRPAVGCSVLSDSPTHKPPASVVMRLLMPEGVTLSPARRLVVLVPDTDLDETAFSRRIWTLAAPNQLAVLYLGSCRTASAEPRARRRLATLAALTRDDWVHVNTALTLDVDWLGALQPQLAGGDLIVCHAEQTRRSWRGSIPLGTELCQALQAPVHLLNGFYAGDEVQPINLPARVLFWGGSAAILAGAFLLQVQISALPKNWAESALMVLSVVAECGLVGLWSRIFN